MTVATRLRRWLCNALIACLLALLLLDGLPMTPAPMRERVEPLVHRLGIWQGPWQLFAPHPDDQNHRLRAEITYHDGERREWLSPVWRELSPLARFRAHRQSEYLDHVWGIACEPCWEPWARDIAHSQRPGATHHQRPREVRMIIEVADVESPAADTWPAVDAPRDYDDRWVLFTRKFP